MNYLFTQVNFGANSASLLGLIYVVYAMFYLVLIVVLLFKRARRLGYWALVAYLIQLIIVPIIMFSCGLILTFQGWRLDPIFQLTQVLLAGLIIYLSLKDIVINGIGTNS